MDKLCLHSPKYVSSHWPQASVCSFKLEELAALFNLKVGITIYRTRLTARQLFAYQHQQQENQHKDDLKHWLCREKRPSQLTLCVNVTGLWNAASPEAQGSARKQSRSNAANPRQGNRVGQPITVESLGTTQPITVESHGASQDISQHVSSYKRGF